jgi:hypothetical protein
MFVMYVIKVISRETDYGNIKKSVSMKMKQKTTR